ncbi:MAG: proprotein convertase P-domain-containing protein [bacterium]
MSTLESDAPGIIRGAEVTVDITHTYRGDLKVILAKDGSPVVLADREGGSADDLKRTFTVHDFDGQAAAGTWTLTVVDTAGQDVGVINTWKLDLLLEGGESRWIPWRARAFAAAGCPRHPRQTSPRASRAASLWGTPAASRPSRSRWTSATFTRATWLVVLEKGARTVTLHNRAGRSADDIKQTFAVDAFNGEELRGEWLPKVSDHRRDVGKINAWSIDATWE